MNNEKICIQHIEKLLKEEEKSIALSDKRKKEMIQAAKQALPNCGGYRRENSRSTILRIRHRWITGFSIPALAIILIFSGIFLFKQPDNLYARIVQKLDKIESIQYRNHITLTTKAHPMIQKIDLEVCVSKKQGIRAKIYENQELIQRIYIFPDRNEGILIYPKQKIYYRVQKTFPQSQIKYELDPKEYLLAFRQKKYKKLQPTEINGVQVKGLEISGELPGRNIKGIARLWYDQKTELPVRIEFIEADPSFDLHISEVVDDFNWNPPLEPETFQPKIDADFLEKQISTPKTN